MVPEFPTRASCQGFVSHTVKQRQIGGCGWCVPVYQVVGACAEYLPDLSDSDGNHAAIWQFSSTQGHVDVLLEEAHVPVGQLHPYSNVGISAQKFRDDR